MPSSLLSLIASVLLLAIGRLSSEL
jgi:hypothetical protein